MDRWLLTLTVLVLFGTGAVLAGYDGFDAAAPQPTPTVIDLSADGWRRTTHGWEHDSAWRSAQNAYIPPGRRIHPVVVGALQLLMAVGALVAFEPRR